MSIFSCISCLGTKEKLEQKMNDIKLIGHDIRVNIKRMKSAEKSIGNNFLFSHRN